MLVDKSEPDCFTYLIKAVQKFGYNACFDYDDIFYTSPTNIISAAINRCWFMMKNVKPGSIFINVDHFPEDALTTLFAVKDLADPKSIVKRCGSNVVEIAPRAKKAKDEEGEDDT
jgi:hypothetical protein